jgi:hypothetical protein
MISMLEYIIFFSAAGEMTFSLFLFGNMTIFNGILFMIGITYKLLPLDELNRKIFPRENKEEVIRKI